MTLASGTPRTWTKVADRPLRSWRKSLAVWCFAHFLGIPVPWRAVRQTDGAELLAFEHARLQDLAAVGERVPKVLSFNGRQMVTADVGPTLDHLLHEMPGPQRLSLMRAASADLARFHAHGQWHGGAQSRNITWDGEHFARLDFEERLLPSLSLATVQAYDMLQLLFSLARLLAELGPQAVCAVLQAYEQAGAPVDMRSFLGPLLPRLERVSRWAAWSSRLDQSREVRRLRTVLEGMRLFLRT